MTTPEQQAQVEQWQREGIASFDAVFVAGGYQYGREERSDACGWYHDGYLAGREAQQRGDAEKLSLVTQTGCDWMNAHEDQCRTIAKLQTQVKELERKLQFRYPFDASGVSLAMEDAGLEAARELFGPEIASTGITRTAARTFYVRMAQMQPAESRLAAGEPVIDHMVNRFLGWKLPEHFHPDAGVSFNAKLHDRWGGYVNSWPVGTNLLTAPQAKAMFEYCLAGAQPPAAQVPDGWQLIPADPTAEMIYAAVAAYEDETGGDRLPDADGADHYISRGMLRAALAAAPAYKEQN